MAVIRVQDARKARKALERSLTKLALRAEVATSKPGGGEAAQSEKRQITRQQTTRQTELARAQTNLDKAEKKLAKAVSRGPRPARAE